MICDLSVMRLRLTTLLLLGACASPTTPEMDQAAIEANLAALADYRTLWETQRLTDYTFDVSRVCYCQFRGDVRVTVKDGVITGVTELASEVARDPETFRTIDGLFDLVQDAYDRDAHEVQVEFDPSRGYPTRIWIDYVLMIADEEMGFTLLSDVTALEADRNTSGLAQPHSDPQLRTRRTLLDSWLWQQTPGGALARLPNSSRRSSPPWPLTVPTTEPGSLPDSSGFPSSGILIIIADQTLFQPGKKCDGALIKDWRTADSCLRWFNSPHLAPNRLRPALSGCP